MKYREKNQADLLTQLENFDSNFTNSNCSLNSAKTKDGILYSKLCTAPNIKQTKIYSALKYKTRPFVNKTKVVTQ